MEKDGSYNWENPKSRLAVLDYELQTFSSYDEGVYYDQAMFMEVNRQLPDLAALVKQRHENLRLVYENYCKRAHLHFPTTKAIVAPTSRTSIQDSSSFDNPLAPKVGRNDPCPCGSGKKYKKCCMN
jgi:preprotein translocase subunit SecA